MEVSGRDMVRKKSVSPATAKTASNQLAKSLRKFLADEVYTKDFNKTDLIVKNNCISTAHLLCVCAFSWYLFGADVTPGNLKATIRRQASDPSKTLKPYV